MKIFEKSYIRVAKAPRFPQFLIRSGVPEQLQKFYLPFFRFFDQFSVKYSKLTPL